MPRILTAIRSPYHFIIAGSGPVYSHVQDSLGHEVYIIDVLPL